MYFSSHLSVDTSSETQIHVVKPTKAFARILNFMTAGSLSEKEEHQTYTAISILQQINQVMRIMGINNIVRLSKDDFDFYIDLEGKKDDLKEALDSFDLKVDSIESSVFNNIDLILEHEDQNFSYLIEITISRIHPVGESPIFIKVDGLLTDFKSGGDLGKLRAEMEEKIFSSQENHDEYLKTKELQFETFIEEMSLSIKKVIKTNGLNHESKKQLIKPKPETDVRRSNAIAHQKTGPAVYHGYYGHDDAFFYAWMWSDLMHSNHYHCHNVHIVNDSGAMLMDVGEEGFTAGYGDSDLLNPEADFETTLQSEAPNTEIGETYDSSEPTIKDSSGWFDSSSDSSYSDSSGGDSGGSSCGSSCGGGCGGD